MRLFKIMLLHGLPILEIIKKIKLNICVLCIIHNSTFLALRIYKISWTASSVFITVIKVFSLFALSGYSDCETIRIHYDINPLSKELFKTN